MEILYLVQSFFRSAFNYSVIPVLLLQGAFLHPYYEPDARYRSIRMWLAPVVIGLAISSQFKRMFFPVEDWLHLNYSWVAVPSFHISCVALQYAFHRGPARKIDAQKEKLILNRSDSSASESDISSSSITNSDSQTVLSSNCDNKEASSSRKELKRRVNTAPRPNTKNSKNLHQEKLAIKGAKPSFAELFKFSLWMTSSPRSLEYTWGPPESILTYAPKKSISWFVMEEILKLIANQIIIIGICAIEQPATVHPRGPRGWLTEVCGLGLPDTQLFNLLIKGIFSSLWSAVGFHIFVVIGCLFNLVEVAFITFSHTFLPEPWKAEKFDPTLYPELFNYPPFRTSLTDFWSKGWHCVFRRDFLFCGAEPMLKLTAAFSPTVQKIAAVMGAMFMSGALHEWGFSSAAGQMDWNFRTTKFFLMGGVGIVLEAMFKKFTGRKVGGFYGWVWLWFWMSLWSQTLMEAWMSRGLGVAGMRGDLEIKNWTLARFLVPGGPLMPDELTSKFSIGYIKKLLNNITG
ncbi:hypothetical protein BY996DRAFT_4591862 [Phakopsora pachyrhizi]|nr:hypothetical protein BY996DRAFT_4591862 [Phakopsora pachyrhizi]